MSGEITIAPGSLLLETALETIYPSKINNLIESLAAQVNAGAIGSDELADGSIPDSKLSSDLQEQLGVPAGSITTAKLATNVLSADTAGRLKMQDGFVTAAELAANAVTETKIADASVTLAKLASGISGTVNVEQAYVSSIYTLASAGSWVDLTGLTVTITPLSASNRMLLMTTIHMSGPASVNVQAAFRFVRDGTAVGVGDTAGGSISVTGVASQMSISSGDIYGGQAYGLFLDTPASAIPVVYKVQAYHPTGNVYFNRAPTDAAGSYRGGSSLIALECAPVAA